MVQPGQVLLEKYRVVRILGEGGMGSVALAEHIHLCTPAAIKFLRPEFLTKKTVVKRFLREAQAAARLQSEHVCRVSDVGTLANGAPYMVMEYMEGLDLRDFAHAHGPLEHGVVADFLLQACEALAEAHAQQIVHRDLKPANLFVARRPDGTLSLKVLDFGISKAQSVIDEEITHTHTVLGTPAYMSPEQMRSAKQADARSDIWSLGVILYELLHGSRPFQGRAFSELCLRVSMDATPPMRVGLPPGLEQLVRRCLEKEPALRFQNVAELAAALAPYAATARTADTAVERATRLLGVTPAWPMPVARAGTANAWPVDDNKGPPTTLGATVGQMGPRQRSRRPLWIAALAAVVLVGAGLGLGLGLSGSGDAQSAIAPADSPIVEPDAGPDGGPDGEPDTEPDGLAEMANDASVPELTHADPDSVDSDSVDSDSVDSDSVDSDSVDSDSADPDSEDSDSVDSDSTNLGVFDMDRIDLGDEPAKKAASTSAATHTSRKSGSRKPKTETADSKPKATDSKPKATDKKPADDKDYDKW